MPDEPLLPRMHNSPAWPTPAPDPDLTDAAREHPDVAIWMEMLDSIGDATIEDNRDQQLYDQAPDALRQQGIEPTPEAIEDWVETNRTT